MSAKINVNFAPWDLLNAQYEMLPVAAQAQAMSSQDELKRRWQVVLTYHGGSPKLWRQYLLWQRAQYATFDVRQISQSYQSAVQVPIIWHDCVVCGCRSVALTLWYFVVMTKLPLCFCCESHKAQFHRAQHDNVPCFVAVWAR